MKPLDYAWRILDHSRIKQEIQEGCLFIHGPLQDDRDQIGPHWVPKDSLTALVEFKPSTESMRITWAQNGAEQSIEAANAVGVGIDFAKVLRECGMKVVLDITSLQLQSIFILLEAFRHQKISNVFAMYVSPVRYLLHRNEELVPDFNLSDSTTNVRSIPGFVRVPDEDRKRTMYVFLGFEGGRFDEMREYFQDNEEIKPVVPLPSYSAGLHVLSLHGNLSPLLKSESADSIKRITSFNPFHALAYLETQYAEDCDYCQMVVAPIGTKPHGMAVALFAVRRRDVIVAYDHPIAKQNRSTGVGDIYGYALQGLIG